jgi:murein DD-endopeptidase MepM/ murein hydrolase activator NlpD
VHIILVSDRLTTAKTIVLTWRHLFMATAALMASVIGLSSLFSYVTVRHAADLRLPFVQELLQAANAEENRVSHQFVRENLNAMAVRLGEMQAQLMRLDSMGERLAGLVGVKPHELGVAIAGKGGRGGPLIQPVPLSADDLSKAVESLSLQVEAKADALSFLENQLLDERIRQNQLPTSLPLDSGWNSSSFGWRVDPITGERGMHEGVDFAADVGTPIRAAAAGIVVGVEKHPEYGYVLDIDHGNDLVTRYAHNSRILVQLGALVKRGQIVSEVGNTGRSTGPHLHFEVRVKGIPQNPNRFLQAAQASGGKLAHRH